MLTKCAALASLVALAWFAAGPATATAASGRKPNIVLVLVDDLGYGDLGSYGSKTILTPRIDQLAAEGTRFTSFYAQTTCGPSRSSLLTGRYPIRSLGWNMPASEITFAELLKQAGYATGIVGKWDVASRQYTPGRMPWDQGFDYFWGTPGGNGNGRVALQKGYRPLGKERDMASLTRRYTDEAIGFIQRHKDGPFLLYLAHTMVHVAIDASPPFKGRSKYGLYGDAVEELDFHTGRLLDEIERLGLSKHTLVLFTSDNGPWSNDQENLRTKYGGAVVWGSAGRLRGAKGSTYEGGIRVPAIARWPGRIPAARTSDAILATVDLLPTFAGLAGHAVPADRRIDGVDQTGLLLGRSQTGQRDDFWYFNRRQLNAVRKGRWKLHLPGREYYEYDDDRGTDALELYDLAADVSESKNLAADQPRVVAELLALAETARQDAGIVGAATAK